MDRFLSNNGPYQNRLPDVHLRNHTSFCFTIALSAAFAVGILFFWHVYLALTNQTTIEFYINLTRLTMRRAKERSTRIHSIKDGDGTSLRVFGDGPVAYLSSDSLEPAKADDFRALPTSGCHH